MKKKKDIIFPLRIDFDLYEKIKKRANDDDRSIAYIIKNIVREKLN